MYEADAVRLERGPRKRGEVLMLVPHVTVLVRVGMEVAVDLSTVTVLVSAEAARAPAQAEPDRERQITTPIRTSAAW
ncbi:MAG: hypothetical protein M3N16_00320 [Actinomycetota bacterium]|nr:hypothetical protein [Actinomycetota bacterium]